MKNNKLNSNGLAAINKRQAYIFLKPERLESFILELGKHCPTDAERESFFKDSFEHYAYSTFRRNYTKGKITTPMAEQLADYLNLSVDDIKGDIIPRNTSSRKKGSGSAKNKTGKKRGRPPKKVIEDDGQMSLDFTPMIKSVVAPVMDQDHDDIDALIAATSDHLKAGVDLGMRWLKLYLKSKGLQEKTPQT